METHFTDVHNYTPDDISVLSSHIDFPRNQIVSSTYSVPVSGWVLSPRFSADPVTHVRLVSGARTVKFKVPLHGAREDAACQFPTADAGRSAAFLIYLDTLDLDETFCVQVQAMTRSERAIPIAGITGRRVKVGAASTGRPAPLMVTTLGRTGGTRVFELLSRHPDVAGFPAFEIETRVVGYWMDVLRSLSRANGTLQQISPSELVAGRTDWFLGPKPAGSPETYVSDRTIFRHLAGPSVDLTRDFCREQARGVMRHCLQSVDKPGATFYVEKIAPGPAVELALREFPGSREVILVRDLRDMYCSIVAFDAKRGTDGFGRSRCESDEHFIAALREGAEEMTFAWTQRRRRGAVLVKYEDVVLKPTETLTRVFTELRLDASDRAVQIALDETNTNAARRAGHLTAKDPVTSIGRWKHDLPVKLHDAFRAHLDDYNVAMGYESISVG